MMNMMMRVMMVVFFFIMFVFIIICIMMLLIMFIIACLFHICFKCAVRPDWKCRGCVVLIIMITAGDAEDA